MRYIALLILLSNCVTRPQIEAELWINDGLPKAICEKNPELVNYGVYRVLPCKPEIAECAGGKETYDELLPYCSDRIKTMLSADRDNVVKWLDQLTKPHK